MAEEEIELESEEKVRRENFDLRLTNITLVLGGLIMGFVSKDMTAACILFSAALIILAMRSVLNILLEELRHKYRHQ